MKAPRKSRRAGATETFSVSVDPQTKRALRTLADREFAGNMSALVTDLAGEARRRLAAGDYLKRHGIAPLRPAELDALQGEIDAEIAEWKKKQRKKRVA